MAGRKGPSLPPNSLDLHNMFDSVLSRLKVEEGGDKPGMEEMERHSKDFFHPDNIFNKTRNFPTSTNSRTARLQACQLLADGKEKEAAKLLMLAQANLFQHQFQLQISKKLSKKNDIVNKKLASKNTPDETDIKDTEEDNETFEERQKRLMLFQSFESTDVESQMSKMPPNWTVVQLAIHEDPLLTRFKSTKKDLPGDRNPSLILVRVAGGKLTVGKCPGPDSSACSTFLKEFTEILKEFTHVNKNVKVKSKYWKLRTDLDNRMIALLSSIEDQWLGEYKSFLMGQFSQSVQDVIIEVVEDIVSKLSDNVDRNVIDRLVCLLSAIDHLTMNQLVAGVSRIIPDLEDLKVVQLVKLFKLKLSSLTSSPREPVIIICDPLIQSLPWESLPCLQTIKQGMSRVPSFPYLHSLWQSHLSDSESVVRLGMAAENVFYLVNPDKSLPDTQERLDKAFQEYKSWEGLAGQEPSKGQIEKALQSKDCYVYCGHGSGSKYMSSDEVEKLRVRSVSFLLGCSSGRLERLGRHVDPLGTAYSYLLASSPAMLGFLWPVTDADVDRWTVSFLTHWLGRQEGSQPQLLQAVADTRIHFKNILNGSAVVVYGLPTKAKVE